MGAQATAWDRNEGRSDTKVGQSERFGGVRADFVATLGRRVLELRAAVARLGEDASSSARRDDLRRRVHALAAAARLLRFNKLAAELAGSEALVDRIAQRGKLTEEDAKQLCELLDRLPELAWSEAALVDPDSVPRPGSTPPRPMIAPDVPRDASEDIVAKQTKFDAPQTILFVGPAHLAEGLATEDDPESFEIERTDDFAKAADLARALAPDVIVIDADKPSARQLVAALLADPMTEEAPIILLGRFVKADDAALYAALGVARTLPKPVSPSALRKAIIEVTASYVKREIARAPIGEVTLDELGKRLAEELRRGLCDAADERARQMRISCGEGSEMLAALWGTVARIRDLVTIESRGAVRFVQSGPEGALPYAPWFGETNARGDQASRVRSLGEARGTKGASLERMSIVVADDDAAITWFLAGVLRSAGATVYEARDGERAFELACEHSPDLVLSDIVMPGLDGFALCRAIKRDFALRDVPVVLLSWKEDLLQRVRELGAGADGYMRKEASAASIVQRLREILGPRLRVAERLARGGEVRGRLEGLTPRTLLSLACTHLPASTLTVRDARDLYEVEIREGHPVRATRTTADGSYERGPGVLARLLGVGSGRFVVVPIAHDDVERLSAARPDLFGSLAEQLVPPIASARAAQRLLSGGSLMLATRVEVDLGVLGSLVDAMPDRARSVLRAIADGASPRDIVVSGSTPARLVEDVLCDAAAHGAISAIVGASGTDLLTPAVQAESERLRGIRRLEPVVVPPLSEVLPEPVSSTPQPVSAVIDRSATPLPAVVRDEPSPAAPIVETNATKHQVEDKPRETLRAAEKPAVLVTPHDDDDDDATTLALLGQSPVSHAAAPKVSANDFTPDVISGVQTYMPPPVAPVVAPEPAPASKGLLGQTATKASDVASESAAVEAAKGEQASGLSPAPLKRAPLEAIAPSVRPPSSEKAPLKAKSASPKPAAVSKKVSPKPPVAKPVTRVVPPMTLGSLEPPPVEELPPPRTALPSSHAPRPRMAEAEVHAGMQAAEPPKRDNSRMRVGAWILFALAGVVFAVGSRVSHQRSLEAAQAQQAAQVAEPADTEAVQAVEPAPEAPVETATSLDRKEGESADFPVLPQDLPLRKEDKVPKGQGLLEVVAGPSDTIFVDGQLIGTGPVVKVPLAPKKDPYEIRLRLRGEERVRFALVKEGRMSRLRIAPPWSR
ncbi:MAG: response regulator [Polyangiaceae bacterium]|nr:response regulator [Polyangiaceae bacterium]